MQFTYVHVFYTLLHMEHKTWAKSKNMPLIFEPRGGGGVKGERSQPFVHI